jgi:hypothetical protein
MRRQETKYEHMWLCSAVVREALREKWVPTQPYETRSVAVLREKWREPRRLMVKFDKFQNGSIIFQNE